MRTVALPIETKVRELHGKLWLGLHLLERGHSIVVGPSWEVNATLNKTQPDTYISHGPSDSKIGYFDKLRQAGIRIYGLAPESGIGAPIEEFMSNKKEIVNHIDGFFCWGEKQKEGLSRNYNNAENIYMTGNPRFDLLHPRFRAGYHEQAEKLKKQYGSFVLVNTNFGIGNPFDQEYIKERLNQEEGLHNVDRRKFIHDQRTFYLFLESILYLSSNLNDLDIIVRPHPSENHEMYSQACAQYDNIHVIHSGDVREWITAAEVVMHHECTTGIESVFIGTPALSYRPIDEKDDEKKIPQEVSVEVFDRSNLSKEIKKLSRRDTEQMSSEQKEILRPYFANIDLCAAEAVCDVIEQKEPLTEKNYQELTPSTRKRIETRVRASKWSDQIIRVNDILQKFKGNESVKIMRKMRHQKFPGLSSDEITDTIKNMNEGIISSVSIEKVSGTKYTYILHTM